MSSGDDRIWITETHYDRTSERWMWQREIEAHPTEMTMKHKVKFGDTEKLLHLESSPCSHDVCMQLFLSLKCEGLEVTVKIVISGP